MQLAQPSMRRTTRRVCLLVVWLLVAGVLPRQLAAQADTQQDPLSVFPTAFESDRFDNPPLRYLGPDPTAHQFLPAAARLENRLAVGTSPPTAETFVAPPEYWPQATVESYLSDEAWPDLMGDEVIVGVTDHKNGFFQKVAFTGTWLDRNNKRDEFGVSELDLSATFALPAPSREWPLLIIPAFNVRYLDGPKTVDLPPRLYETYLEFLWLPRFHPRWTGIVAFAPALYSDFEVDDNDAWRLTGKGLVRFDWVPNELQAVVGVLYLNREDVRLLPAGGLIWTPRDDRRYELLFPRPKLAHRIGWGPGFEDWLYLGGEFGGNSYAVGRFDGTADNITLRDFRTYVGVERKLNGGAGYRVEIGYVMGRVIEFQSNTPDIEADDTAMIRGGIVF